MLNLSFLMINEPFSDYLSLKNFMINRRQCYYIFNTNDTIIAIFIIIHLEIFELQEQIFQVLLSVHDVLYLSFPVQNFRYWTHIPSK